MAAYQCAQFPFETTGFHPLFFYEASLSLIGGLLALWIGRRFVDRLRPGDLFSFWLIWYGFVRAYLETFREGWNWAVQGIPVATAISVAGHRLRGADHPLAAPTSVDRARARVHRRRRPADRAPSPRPWGARADQPDRRRRA